MAHQHIGYQPPSNRSATGTARHTVGFEWYTGEGTFPQNNRPTSLIPEVPPLPASPTAERRILLSVARAFLLFALCLTIAKASPTSPRQIALAELKAKIQAVADQEMTAWRTNNRAGWIALIDPHLPIKRLGYWDRHWRIEPSQRFDAALSIQELSVVEVDFGPGPTYEHRTETLVKSGVEGLLVIADLVDARESHARFVVVPSVERRYYRKVDGRWLRTLPPASFWGAAQSIETAHLRLKFTAHDAPDLIPLAAELDEIYRRIHQLFNVPLSPSIDEILTLSTLPQVPSAIFAPSTNQIIASPSVAERPAGQSGQAFLRHSMATRFVDVALSKTRLGLEHTYWQRWDAVLWGARGWAVEEILDEESPWDQQAQETFLKTGGEYLPLAVSQLGYHRPNRDYLLWQYMASKTLFEYVEAEFGQDKVAALVRGFNGYRSWTDLIENVLAVSVAEFEAGWNGYLAENYSELGNDD